MRDDSATLATRQASLVGEQLALANAHHRGEDRPMTTHVDLCCHKEEQRMLLQQLPRLLLPQMSVNGAARARKVHAQKIHNDARGGALSDFAAQFSLMFS